MTTPTIGTPPDRQRRIDDGFISCFENLELLIRKEFGSVKSARTICKNHDLKHWNKIVQNHAELSWLLQQDGGNTRMPVQTSATTSTATV